MQKCQDLYEKKMILGKGLKITFPVHSGFITDATEGYMCICTEQ